ncbi:hypothetical protein MTR_4g113300 [Medicago truncatula]|uniref:Uncharacterized protein n=1 Tax=Medicago truncatula TaxID=3880 RepID=G7JU79_MEDTR|nr:hypothetical protein MTR_4g113300 [Medicago truncatula]
MSWDRKVEGHVRYGAFKKMDKIFLTSTDKLDELKAPKNWRPGVVAQPRRAMGRPCIHSSARFFNPIIQSFVMYCCVMLNFSL